MQSSIALAQIRASHGHILTSLGSHTLLICLGFSILLCSASFPCTSAWFSHISFASLFRSIIFSHILPCGALVSHIFPQFLVIWPCTIAWDQLFYLGLLYFHRISTIFMHISPCIALWAGHISLAQYLVLVIFTFSLHGSIVFSLIFTLFTHLLVIYLSVGPVILAAQVICSCYLFNTGGITLDLILGSSSLFTGVVIFGLPLHLLFKGYLLICITSWFIILRSSYLVFHVFIFRSLYLVLGILLTLESC